MYFVKKSFIYALMNYMFIDTNLSSCTCTYFCRLVNVGPICKRCIEKSCNKTKDLIKRMKEVLGSFNMDTVVKACKSLWP